MTDELRHMAELSTERVRQITNTHKADLIARIEAWARHTTAAT